MNQFKELTPEYKQLIKVCCKALDDTKADDIAILNVSAQSSLTNFLILATANSNPHLKALKRDLDHALKFCPVCLCQTGALVTPLKWYLIYYFLYI